MRGFILFAFILFSGFQAFTQVVLGGDQATKKTRKESVSDEKDSLTKRVPDGFSSVYLIANWSKTSRVLKENVGFYGDSLGTRADETSLNLWSYGIGIQNSINANWMWDGGLAFSRNGESYRFSEQDSTFSYKTYYSYISMPIRINYTIGKGIKFYLGTGLMPQIFMKFKQEQKWVYGDDNSGSETIETNSGYSSFVLSGLFNAGVMLNFGNGWSLLVSPEVRIQMTSSYMPQDSYIHKARAYGISFGLTRNL